MGPCLSDAPKRKSVAVLVQELHNWGKRSATGARVVQAWQSETTYLAEGRFQISVFAAAFRAESRTGMQTFTSVPEFSERIVSAPPKSRTLSRIPARPTPVSPPATLGNRSFGMPLPLSPISR